MLVLQRSEVLTWKWHSDLNLFSIWKGWPFLYTALLFEKSPSFVRHV